MASTYQKRFIKWQHRFQSVPLLNMAGSQVEKKDMHEYLRPWKLLSFCCGLALLIAGAYYYQAPDWDVPISIIMATLTYLTAPWSLRVVLERRWRSLPAALLAIWFTVDGCYWIYWHYKDPVALEMMREANFWASLSLYGICGVLWLYRGSVREFFAECRKIFRLKG